VAFSSSTLGFFASAQERTQIIHLCKSRISRRRKREKEMKREREKGNDEDKELTGILLNHGSISGLALAQRRRVGSCTTVEQGEDGKGETRQLGLFEQKMLAVEAGATERLPNDASTAGEIRK
jgi:hypothetical protein